jgi:hypothetical protein
MIKPQYLFVCSPTLLLMIKESKSVPEKEQDKKARITDIFSSG